MTPRGVSLPGVRRRPSRGKRIKRNTFAVQRTQGKHSDRGRTPTLVMPTREALLNWSRVALLLLVAAGVAIALIYLLRWPLLAVSPASTQIGGAQRTKPEEIYEWSQVDGRNIMVLETSDVVSKVKSLPGVASADVHLRLPNQVIIDVVEHAPLVAWQGMTTTVWLAANGSEVPQAGAVPPLRLTDVSEGRLENDAPLRALLLENLASVHALRPELSEFYYGRSQGLFYRAAEGWDVWLGESGPIGSKLATVDAAGQALMQQSTPAKVIDVRHADREVMWW